LFFIILGTVIKGLEEIQTDQGMMLRSEDEEGA